MKIRKLLRASDLRRNVILQISDARTLAPVWSKPYPKESPRVRVSPRHDTLALVCVENERGKIAVYDLSTTEKRDELVFSNPVSMPRFSGDGKKLLVLTSNQTVYVVDAAALAGAKVQGD
jgi:Tol biopolymer transport system component